MTADSKTPEMPATRQSGEREVALVDAFVALADTLVDDYDIVELLDRLVNECVKLLGASAAGLLLFDRDQLRLIASSSERVEHLEVFQVQADEGPCLDCARSAQPISVPDLDAVRERWPVFCAAASEAGFRAVHAVPLRLRSQAVGGLNLFDQEIRTWTDQELHVAQALADVATIGILQERAIHRSDELTQQLQTALNSRVIIEQAKGMIAEHSQVDMTTAFAQLRRYARDRNLKLSLLAREVVAGTVPRTAFDATAPRHPR
jgi:GAF domain-containing protein